MSKPGSIFISYRRSDSITEAGRIYDRLVSAFGSEYIFKDVDNIPYGADFVDYLDQAVGQCDVFLPLIGPTWLGTTDANGNRRLDDPHDFVRIEIASALRRDILVVPLLLNGALMPGLSDLPADLQALARRNAAQVRHDPDFHNDMGRLITKLEEYFTSRNIPLPQKATPQQTIKNRPAPTSSTGKAHLIPAILSCLGGLTALLIGGSMGGELIDYGIGVLLFVVGGLLFSRQLWTWGVAIAMQIVAIILCSVETFHSAFDEAGNFSPTVTTYVLALVPAIALITLIALLLPKVRRTFH